MTTYPFRARRWTRKEYRKLDELGVLPEDEPIELIDGHPARPVLVVEVAETSLRFDRCYKGSAYARAGLPDYWIVNTDDWQVEVYRRPGVDATAELGWRYVDRTVVAPGGTIVPLARP